MGTKIVISLLVLTVAYFARSYFNPPLVKSPVVETRTGKVQGLISSTRDGRDFFEYLGIPYAKPPVGDLRFEPPEPLTEKSDVIRDATAHGSVCIQADLMFSSIKGTEDCLFLNVHTPKLKGAKLPVMVWFHGGLFSFGSGSEYLPDYFLDEGVLVVTVNYRVASFGFLNTGDGIIRGNMGLKDQNMALKWVKDNIAAFGGNPNDVTIFGESAGGASVHYQMLSPMSKGLFQKAISQSGLATNPWALNPSPSEQAKRFAKQLQCPVTDTKEMVKCLKSRDANDIVTIHMEMADSLRPVIAIFLPTIEKDISDGKTFLTQKPRTLIESGNFNKVPFMAGVNDQEGLLVSAPLMTNKTLFGHLSQNWEKSLPPLSFMPEGTADAKKLEKIRNFYVDANGPLDVENPFKHFEGLTNLFSDYVWKLGFHTGLMSHSKQVSASNPLFIYYYTYEGDFSLAKVFLALKGDYHPIIEIMKMKVTTWFKNLIGQEDKSHGACHGDELAMLFEIPMLSSVPKNSKDYNFSKNIVKLWASFAKTEIKSLKSLEFMGQKWPAQESNKPLKYMQLNTEPKLISEPDQERLAFWDSINIS